MHIFHPRLQQLKPGINTGNLINGSLPFGEVWRGNFLILTHWTNIMAITSPTSTKTTTI